jgi:ParB-like chromosome segregation protein Spo0J
MPQLLQAEFSLETIEQNSHGFQNSRTNLGDVTELKNSIIRDGLHNPPIVYKCLDDNNTDRYILLAGHRRFAAINEHRNFLIQENGATDGWFDAIQCSVFEGTFEEAFALNISENLQRQDLNYADKAAAISRLLDRVGNQTQVADMLSISQPNVSQMVQVYSGLCREGLEALRNGQITLSFAKRLSKLVVNDGTPNVPRQCEILDEHLDKGEDVPEGEQRKRAKTFRTKREFEELRTLLITNEDASVDKDHRASMMQFLDWVTCSLETEDMFFRDERYYESDAANNTFEHVFGEDEDLKPKRRIRVNE